MPTGHGRAQERVGPLPESSTVLIVPRTLWRDIEPGAATYLVYVDGHLCRSFTAFDGGPAWAYDEEGNRRVELDLERGPDACHRNGAEIVLVSQREGRVLEQRPILHYDSVTYLESLEFEGARPDGQATLSIATGVLAGARDAGINAFTVMAEETACFVLSTQAEAGPSGFLEHPLTGGDIPEACGVPGTKLRVFAEQELRYELGGTPRVVEASTVVLSIIDGKPVATGATAAPAQANESEDSRWLLAPVTIGILGSVGFVAIRRWRA